MSQSKRDLVRRCYALGLLCITSGNCEPILVARCVGCISALIILDVTEQKKRISNWSERLK